MTEKRPPILGLVETRRQTQLGIGEEDTRCQCKGTGDAREEELRTHVVALLPRLRRFAYSLTRDDVACDDLVQETCLRALSKSALWQEGTRVDSWLYRIAQNIWLDQIRRQRTRGYQIDVDDALDVVGSDGRDITEARLTLDSVKEGIASLNPNQQIVIALVCVDGMSYQEAADILELPVGTIMSRLSRARLALHAYLAGAADSRQGVGTETKSGRSVR